MSWYMRGGLSYTEAMHLSMDERDLINAIIKENLDTTKKQKCHSFKWLTKNTIGVTIVVGLREVTLYDTAALYMPSVNSI